MTMEDRPSVEINGRRVYLSESSPEYAEWLASRARTDAGRTMLSDPMYRYAIGHVRAIEDEAEAMGARKERERFAADEGGE